jgi:hypothetical protein
MRIPITPKFSKYLLDNSHIFPYSKLMVTRQSCYCKWIMLQGHDAETNEYFPVLANTIPIDLLLELLATEAATPLSPELSDVMDVMYWWGKKKNIVWYEDVIDIVAEAVDMDIEYDRKELFRAMISGQVRDEIHKYFCVQSLAAELLCLNWISWYNGTYHVGPQTFIGICRYSLDYVEWIIGQVNNSAVNSA